MQKAKQKSDKRLLLDQIKADITAKDICPDLAKEATNLVMGVGNPDAEVMFIGEAPGKNEDLQGEPFVGAAGKFLDEMLTMVGMRREDVYISNIVKYRPPNNRDPLPDEKKAFWPFLLREIHVIGPKIIATLGRHSMEYFLPDMRISKIHGQPKRIRLGNGKIVILPLFHPAAALYNSAMRETLIDDFQAVPKIIELINNDDKQGK
ncbi:MAG TPA: uracil-DNA glycosylase [Candidatus Saccharimonadales bacterium]|nr:uracil-DNA glycosylase [Candidatus Saccharimonadales bacterium]